MFYALLFVSDSFGYMSVPLAVACTLVCAAMAWKISSEPSIPSLVMLKSAAR